MSRLTFRDSKGELWIKDAADIDEQGQICMLTDRLAAYEDIGLEPEEIKDHEEMFAAYRHVCGGKSPEEIVHALELMEAERNGRLVVLPCKVGDTVYKHWKVGGKTEIGSALVTGFEIANDGINYCYRVKRFDRKETIKKFGKTVFLTREEAEAALAKEGEAP